MEPKHGARVQLERDAVSAAGARYRVRVWVATPKSTGSLEGERYYESSAELGASDVTLAPFSLLTSHGPPPAWSQQEPPQWARTFSEQLLKTLPKKHAEAGDWPRKLTRWRQEH